jgi:hypothetical protein
MFVPVVIAVLILLVGLAEEWAGVAARAQQ